MLKAIWAQSLEGIIGVDGELPWHIPEDLAHFKELTMGQTVIMGRKTWESLPVRPLPGRENIILSHRAPGEWSLGARVVQSLDGLGGWIIGGEQVYGQAMPLVEELHVTLVRHMPKDYRGHLTFAPVIGSEWERTTHGYQRPSVTPNTTYQHHTFHRIPTRP